MAIRVLFMGTSLGGRRRSEEKALRSECVRRFEKAVREAPSKGYVVRDAPPHKTPIAVAWTNRLAANERRVWGTPQAIPERSQSRSPAAASAALRTRAPGVRASLAARAWP